MKAISAEQFRKEINRLCVKHGGKNNGRGITNPRFEFPFAGGMTVELIGDGAGRDPGFIAIRFENPTAAAETGLPCAHDLNQFSGKWNIQSWPSDLRGNGGMIRSYILAALRNRLEHFTGPLPDNVPPGYVAAEQKAFNFAMCGEKAGVA